MKELTRRILRKLEISDLEIECSEEEIQEPMPSDWRYLIYPSVPKSLGIDRDLKYRFWAILTGEELKIIPEKDIGKAQILPIENGNQYAVKITGDFETYMRMYIHCLQAALMLL